MMRWSTGPYAPRLPIVSLPAESPRPATAYPDRLPSSQAWPTSSFAPHRQFPPPSAPIQGPGRNYEYTRAALTRSYSTSSSHTTATHNSSMQHESRQRVPAGAHETSTSYRFPTVERTRSMTPVPALKSILKTSRTRSQSISSNPEPSRDRHTAVPAQAEPRRSNLSKLQTVTVHHTKPLKEESIALSWPLVKFLARKNSRSPLLYFDAGFDPRLPINLRDNKSGQMSSMSDGDRKLPASTHCTLTEMVIQCPKIGKITVKRSRGIRCIDVFSAVYDAYHEPVRSGELPEDMGRYLRHFHKRCEDCPRPAEEQRAGLRRVDLLRGKRIFDGLSRSGADWKLDFDS
ncbi:Metallo-beta-lactamase protein [Mycena venus]|uniref:Metallo-beta-lactamase protein n=1 Tax=Mycena venus TaxID=2733690 RepID=A0A8H6YUT1_9AGAR|nr:Metallo-beta-lactamase protein [Mycena venus]